MDTDAAEKTISIKTWLFNPFHYIAGARSLSIGMIVLMASSLVGSISHSHFDGVLDFHSGLRAPLLHVIAEGFISWLAMGATVFLGGLVLSKTRFRVVDVFGTQALARFPHFFTSLVALMPGYGRFSDLVAAQPFTFSAIARSDPGGLISFIIVMIVVIVMTVWMVYLMYRAFSVSCNVAGAKAIITFIVAVIVAEILSKILIHHVSALIF